MRIPIEEIKLELEEIMAATVMFEQNERSVMQKCVDAVKRYLDKIKAIKSYKVNCHGKFDENIGQGAILTVVLIPHEGKPVTLTASLWPTPANLDFVAGKPTKKLTSKR